MRGIKVPNRARRPEGRESVLRWAGFSLLSILVCSPAVAQIVPDATLPINSRVTNQGNNILIIEAGTRAGNNLFHSFSQFSVLPGGAAFFNNAPDVQNIFSRVTGSSISNVDGILGANGTANLFLLNPNGIIFGKNAQLSIGGSFVGTTANAIKFGNQGVFSATNPNNPSVLTINPSAFLFNQIAAQGANSIENHGNLLINEGKSLLLVGGNVSPTSTSTGGILIDGTGDVIAIRAPGGRIEFGGLAAPGEIGLNIDANNPGLMSLSFPNGVERVDVSLANTVIIDVAGGGGGSFAVNARNLNLSNQSFIYGGIDTGLGTAGAQAGDVTVNATGGISIENDSGILNSVFSGSTGKAGDINVTARSLSLRTGGEISSFSLGQGNTGNIKITVSDGISLDGIGSSTTSGIFSRITRGAVGNGGDIQIAARSLSVTNGAQIGTATAGKGKSGNLDITVSDGIVFDGVGSNKLPSVASSEVDVGGAGDAGNLNITARRLSVTNGAQINAATFGQGNAGNVTLNVSDKISVDGVGSNGFSSGIGSSVETQGVGKGGNVNIAARELSVTNGGILSVVTSTQGNAGNLTIAVRDGIYFDGVGSNGNLSSASSSVQPGAVGNGGEINITAGSLALTNGALVNSATFGQGNAGNIIINVGDNILLDRGTSRTFSGVNSSVQPEAVGKGGNINVTARRLALRNGSEISVATSGRGNAGDVTITASDVISLDGMNVDGTLSDVNSEVVLGGIGNGGNINITTPSLSLTNRAEVSAAIVGQGTGGTININADTLNAANGAKLFATTSSNGRAGDINITATKSFTLSGADTGVFTSTTPISTGNGGNLSIKAGQLTIRDRAQVTAQSSGTGDAGNILNISARSLTLDNGSITTTSLSGNGGNINNIQVDNLLQLRNGSVISTTAGTNNSGGGNGGNITINPQTLIALENSNIAANAFQGRGGNIQINTQGLFNSPDTAITASSQLGVQGTVQINILGFDVRNTFVPITANLLSVEQAIASSCLARRTREQGKFTVTGTGGLPVNPDSDIDESYPIPKVSLITSENAQPSAENQVGANHERHPYTDEYKWKIGDPIVEAKSIIVLPDGRTILSAMPPQAHPTDATSLICHE